MQKMVYMKPLYVQNVRAYQLDSTSVLVTQSSFSQFGVGRVELPGTNVLCSAALSFFVHKLLYEGYICTKKLSSQISKHTCAGQLKYSSLLEIAN